MSAFHIEELIGTVVRDEAGRKLGRISEMIAEERDGELVIVEYHLGKGAFLEQVSMSLRNMFGRKPKEPLRVSWEKLDLRDPSRPLLQAVGQSGSQAV